MFRTDKSMKEQGRQPREQAAASAPRKHTETLSAGEAATTDLGATTPDVSTSVKPPKATYAAAATTAAAVAPGAATTPPAQASTLTPEYSVSLEEGSRTSRTPAGTPVASSSARPVTFSVPPVTVNERAVAPITAVWGPNSVETSLVRDTASELAWRRQVPSTSSTPTEVNSPAVLLTTPVTTLGVAQDVSDMDEGPIIAPSTLTRTGRKTVAELEGVNEQQVDAMSTNGGESNSFAREIVLDVDSFEPMRNPRASLLIYAVYSIFSYVAGFSVAEDSAHLPQPIHHMVEHQCAHTSGDSICFFAQGIRSVSAAGVAAGCLLGGFFADYYGRKTLMCLSDAFLFLGVLLPHAASNFLVFCASRVLSGMGLGGGLIALVVFLVETVPASSRGLSLAVERLFELVGRLSAISLAARESQGGILFGVPVTSFLLLLHGTLMVSMAPESPRWLIAWRRPQKAIAALLCFGNTEFYASETVLRQEQAIRLAQALQGATPPQSKCSGMIPKTYRQLFDAHKLKLGLGITFACVAACTGAGLFENFPTMSNVGIFSSQDFVTTSAILQTVGVVLSVALVDCLGRGPILRLGTIGVAVGFSLASAGCFWHTYLSARNSSSAEISRNAAGRDSSQSLAIVGVLSAQLMQNLSWSTLLPLVVSEVHPTSVRATGSGLAIGLLTVLELAGNLLIACFPSKNLPGVTFAAYAVLSYIATGLLTLGFTEGKGRRLEELAPEIVVEDVSRLPGARCWTQAGPLEEGSQRDQVSRSQVASRRENFATTSASTVDEEAHSMEIETMQERQHLERELAAVR